MIEISVVIPVYNSEGNLYQLYLEIEEALTTITHEVIFVNDCSRDSSWTIIRGMALSNKNITAVNLRKNSGQDNALMAGFSFVKGKYVVIMDDDLQHSPYDIVKLHNKIIEGFDVCYANFNVRKHAWWKNVGSRFNGLLANILLHKPKDIYLSPFKIISTEIIKEINYSGPFPYVDGLILEITHNTTSIQVDHFKRYKGESTYSLLASIKVFMKLLTTFSIIPLRIASIVGTVIAAIGFLLGFYFIYLFFTNKTVEGWTSLIVTVLILGGILLMSIGLIGEYLGRMYLLINRKPQFTVKEVVKAE